MTREGSQNEIAELFQTTKQNISKHIKTIFQDGELDERSTVNYKLTVQKEGNREISRQVAYYSLDMILSIGYRVRSIRGIQFRNYATTILKEYLIKGFAMPCLQLRVLRRQSYTMRNFKGSRKIYRKKKTESCYNLQLCSQ